MKFVFVLALIFSSLNAQAGPGVSGGGDECENRIQTIATDIKTWIGDGGPNSLVLPNGVTHQAYSTAMLDGVSRTRVICVGQGDVGYPVEIFGTPKICRFDRQGADSRVTCDFEKFRSLTDEEQYSLVHHEYAGLAGLEPAVGDKSQYTISNQISGYLIETIVKKLSVNPPVNGKALCEKGIRAYIARKFPNDRFGHAKAKLTSVKVDLVEFDDASGYANIEAHALYDEYGIDATRIFLQADALYKDYPGRASQPSGCKNFRVRGFFLDSLSD